MNQSYPDIQTEQTENVWSMNLPGALLCFPEKAWKILLCEYSAADPVGDTERGVFLLEERIFFLSQTFCFALWLWLRFSLMLFLYEVIVCSVQTPMENVQTPLLFGAAWNTPRDVNGSACWGWMLWSGCRWIKSMGCHRQCGTDRAYSQMEHIFPPPESLESSMKFVSLETIWLMCAVIYKCELVSWKDWSSQSVQVTKPT